MAALFDGARKVLPFGFEERLQDLIALTPELLASPHWAAPRLLLGREIPVHGEMAVVGGPAVIRGPASERAAQNTLGRMDVCFAEADGTPTIVEAKLAANGTMKDVLDQALGYAEDLFASPSKAAMAMRSALGGLADRYPDSPGVHRLVGTTLPGWTPDDLRERIQQHLERRRCRVIIVADALPPKVVRDAALRHPALNGVHLDLVNVRRMASGSPSIQRIELDPVAYERGYRPPAEGKPSWEPVERMPVQAKAFVGRMVKDRFFAKDGYRIKRTGALPAVLHYEAAPGRAPLGDLHQVERSRRESCAPVMPNLDMLAGPTRNPYPQDGWSKTIMTDDRYRPIVAICYATWEFLCRHEAIKICVDDTKLLQREIAKRAGVRLDSLSSEVGWVALTAPFDAMRDCALYGLVRHSRRRHNEHRFERCALPTNFARVSW